MPWDAGGPGAVRARPPHLCPLAGALFLLWGPRASASAGRAMTACVPASGAWRCCGRTPDSCSLSSPRLDGSMETTNEILDSTSHDCPLVAQAYGTAAAKGAPVPSSPTALGKGGGRSLEGPPRWPRAALGFLLFPFPRAGACGAQAGRDPLS